MHTQRTKIILANKIRELISICFFHSLEDIEFKYIITVEYNTLHSKLDICILDGKTCDVVKSSGVWNVRKLKPIPASLEISKLKIQINHYIKLNQEWNLSKAK